MTKAMNSGMRIYTPATCAVFRTTRDEFGGYHNMAGGYPLIVNDIPIRTSEALYQACRFPHLIEIQKIIIAQKSPMTAKMKGKPHREKSRPDWDNVMVNIMRWCLRVKLALNFEKFSSLLLLSQRRQIVEHSRKDDYWGAKMTEDGKLVGKNVMGRLTMELREDVRNKPAEEFLIVEPLDIPDFLLFGKPIRRVQGKR